MNKTVDKLVVLACCCVGCAATGQVGGAAIAVMLVFAACVFAVDVVPLGRLGRASTRVRAGVPVVLPLFVLAVPAGAVFLALPVYCIVSASIGERAAREGGPGDPGSGPGPSPGGSDLAAGATREPAPSAALAWVLVPAVVWALCSFRGMVPVQVACLSLGLATLAGMLSWRTSTAAEFELEGRRVHDMLRERSISLESANRDLVDSREYELKLAVLEERGRIAREIHDNVGHMLTRATLQAEAMQVVHASDETVRDEFAQIGETVSSALDMVRSSVHDLRDDSIDLSVQVAAIAGDCPLQVSTSVSVGEAPADVGSCICAIVREALSNSARHGDATRVEVSLVEHPGLWQLVVRDNGTVAPPSAPSHGMGLQSMEERARRLGGTFRAGFDGGFRITVGIPKAPVETMGEKR